ncbi:Gfo/Idh/MocA family protein [Granulosicoccus antarcticus]|uniref:Scyllo-inositol 2-dehydrogenase (NADP(+)) n=1 Tax=Granulosicoccus antarcticus IMCC3135 TaxID=1192854 RepID=A0A2Z2NV71_9GAMM|nr:Gfo/Idh/MocA family oxidoreductase [Granulosicoccus antarcticus]ASJ72690.1 scyllo-inositol 2-dehydrogenase (NADP(+)) [Granulosicoccus antarcticus IMCC3135]
MAKILKFAAVGIDHRHIFGQIQNMLDVGAEFAGWWTEGEPETLDGFVKRFDGAHRFASLEELLGDASIELILVASLPCDRAGHAISAMQAGKDVMVDKPGCTTLEQLDQIKQCVAETKRIWSIDFSERFEVASVTKAASLVQSGAIGKVIQTLGMGPHRLNRPSRPDWFFDRQSYGGIICDIASHQIDQFLYFTGSTDAQIRMATVGNYANPDDKGLQDFGEVALQSDNGHGYIRVDWYTPDALPTWGDGRLTILGTEGYIELRKYVDVARDTTIDNLFLVNGTRHEQIDCSDAGYPYFQNLANDIAQRTETAMPQAHAFKVMELALKAQAMAEQMQPAGHWS